VGRFKRAQQRIFEAHAGGANVMNATEFKSIFIEI